MKGFRESIVAELAFYRLRDASYPHNYILKKHPAKKFGDKNGGFSYCTDCKNYAWALELNCPTKYKATYKAEVLALLGGDKG